MGVGCETENSFAPGVSFFIWVAGKWKIPASVINNGFGDKTKRERFI